MPVWLIVMFAMVAIEAVAFAIMPRPAQPKPPAVQDGQAPVADASKPMQVVFGEITIDETNVLWTGDKSQNTYDVSA